MHVYAYDVKLAAVIRVSANSEKEAEKILNNIQALTFQWDGSINAKGEHFDITEASVDDVSPALFEIDGKEVL